MGKGEAAVQIGQDECVRRREENQSKGSGAKPCWISKCRTEQPNKVQFGPLSVGADQKQSLRVRPGISMEISSLGDFYTNKIVETLLGISYAIHSPRRLTIAASGMQ